MHVSNLHKKLGSHPDGSLRVFTLCGRGYYYSHWAGFVSPLTQGLYPSFTQG